MWETRVLRVPFVLQQLQAAHLASSPISHGGKTPPGPREPPEASSSIPPVVLVPPHRAQLTRRTDRMAGNSRVPSEAPS